MSNNTPYNVIFRCIYCMYPLHYRVPKQEDHEIKECATSSLLSKIPILNPISYVIYYFMYSLQNCGTLMRM